MSTLVLRYATPLAAFGHSGRFDNRPSAATPTLSAIQGMFAAAAGIGRHQQRPDWVDHLDVAIRIDAPGQMVTDYHTVNQPPERRYRWLNDKDRKKVRQLATADGKNPSTQTVLSQRGYVADATFVIAAADPDSHLTDVLEDPTFALYAGRKACPLTEPLILGHTSSPPLDTLATVATVRRTDDDSGNERLRRDVICFAEPDRPASHIEDRNDRHVAFQQWTTQRRWHTTVDVLAVDSWFDLVDDLQGASR